MNLNNGDEQNIQLGKGNYLVNSDHNLFIPQCMMGAINELIGGSQNAPQHDLLLSPLLRFTGCLLICVFLNEFFFKSLLIRTLFIKYFGVIQNVSNHRHRPVVINKLSQTISISLVVQITP